MKKKLAIRLYEAFIPPKPRAARRSYAGARKNRLNADWTTSPTGANYEIRTALAPLRARARQAARDNGLIRNFLHLMRTNVIGHKGIQMQSRARLADGKTLNVDLNKRVEEAWFDWGHRKHCSLSGKLDWRGVQKLALTHLLRDGEFLIQMVEGVGEYGLSLKVWDVNWLDETYNVTLTNGNRIIMSVEVDVNYKPLAYWLTMPASEMNFARHQDRRQRTRIPAEQMIHGFLVSEDESQVRGVTWLAATLLNLKLFQGYTEGVVVSARHTAETSAFVTQEVNEENPYYGEIDEETGSVIPQTFDSAPGSIHMLDPGQSIEQIDPKQPTQNHSAFSTTMQTSIGTDVSVPYFLLVGDWSEVNFSSSRGGLGEYHQLCQDLQDFIAMLVCTEVAHVFQRNAVLAGKLDVTPREFLEIEYPEWQPRGFPYIDPTKDIKADVERLNARLATPSQILGERGIDYVDHLERWQADREMAATYGVDIEAIYSPQPKQLAAPVNDDEDDDEIDDDEKKKKKKSSTGTSNGRELKNGHLAFEHA
jgi:lambda family phage portal protein